MLDHVKHVEAVAILNAIMEQPAAATLPEQLRDTVKGWLAENHPPPAAYKEAMRSLTGSER